MESRDERKEDEKIKRVVRVKENINEKRINRKIAANT